LNICSSLPTQIAIFPLAAPDGPQLTAACHLCLSANGIVKMVYRGACGSRLDDECASPFSDGSGLRSDDLDHQGRRMRWCISLVWTCR
jgi:hypothetical protein